MDDNILDFEDWFEELEYRFLSERETSTHMSMRRSQRKVKSPMPFDNSRLYGDEKYSLNDMLLGTTEMPHGTRGTTIPEGYGSHTVWSDHAHDLWTRTCEIAKPESSARSDAFWSGVSSTDLLAFARAMAVEVNVREEVVGTRIVRFTNRKSQYPVLRLDIIYKKTRLVESVA